MNDRIVIKSSPTLHAMYVDWLAWAEACAPSEPSPLGFGYYPSLGLCYAARCFADNCWGVIDVLEEYEMRGQFVAAGLDPVYPFGEEEFHHRSGGTQHEDPNRLAWVRARIADGIEEDPNRLAWVRARIADGIKEDDK